MDQKPGFDIIGDVHGHAALLEKLLRKLGYVKYGKTWGHPDGRIAVFTGDLINRGPEQVETVKLVRRMVRKSRVRRSLPVLRHRPRSRNGFPHHFL